LIGIVENVAVRTMITSETVTQPRFGTNLAPVAEGDHRHEGW